LFLSGLEIVEEKKIDGHFVLSELNPSRGFSSIFKVNINLIDGCVVVAVVVVVYVFGILLEGSRLLAEGTLDLVLGGLLGDAHPRIEVDFGAFSLLEGIDEIKDLKIAYSPGKDNKEINVVLARDDEHDKR